AAVLRAVIDAGEHDHRRLRLQREGDRQEDRDGGDGAEAGQHADDRAEQNAEEAVEDVGAREGDGEAEAEMVQKIHPRLRQRGSSGSGRPRPQTKIAAPSSVKPAASTIVSMRFWPRPASRASTTSAATAARKPPLSIRRPKATTPASTSSTGRSVT